MKMKLNLSKEGIQEFLLANGEKFLLGVTGIILLGFFYGAITAKPLDDSMSPDAIKTASSKVQSVLSDPNWAEQKSALHLPDASFPKSVETSNAPVAVGPYRQLREWDPALFPELTRRAEPKIFPVEKLQIASGVGLLAYQIPPEVVAQANAVAGATATTTSTAQRIDPTAQLPGAHVTAAESQGKPYVVITGLVPVDKEAQEFNDRFTLAMPAVADPNRPVPVSPPTPGQAELPQYAVCLVQRREVTPTMKADDKWPNVSYKDVRDDMRKWAMAWGVGQDIVDGNYVFQNDEIPIPGGDGTSTITRLVTMPLPPLLLKDWGLEAAHPEIRLNTPEDATTATPVNPDTPAADFGFGDKPADNPGAMKSPPAAGTPAPNPAPPPRTLPPPPVRSMPFAGRGDHGSERSERSGPGSGYRPMPSVNYASAAPSQTVSVPNKLFRFVDFMVEPGKTYQYRVQLFVVNPNFGLKAECLQKAETSNDKWVKSDFTDPTPPVTVPRLYQILAENVMGGARGTEPRARVNFFAVFKAPVSENATAVPASHEVWLEGMKDIENWALGSVLSVGDGVFKDIVDPTSMEIRTVTPTIDSDLPLLLDVRNEDPLGSSKSKMPTEMLYIDGAGHLSVSNSAVDRFAQDDYRQMTKAATTSSTTVTGGQGTGGFTNEHAPQPAPAKGSTPATKGGRARE
jgi:hypothetical protein